MLGYFGGAEIKFYGLETRTSGIISCFPYAFDEGYANY
jgi:hypothetical protein